jgi:hypothetical protein
MSMEAGTPMNGAAAGSTGGGPGAIDRAAARVVDDIACEGCGYNLRGLPASGKCPECGRPVTRARRGRYERDMVAAPLPWLRKMSWAANLLALAAFAQLGAVFAPLVLGSLSFVLVPVVVVSPVVWLVGVFAVTRPRPMMPSVAKDSVQEWAKLRMWTRILQFGWPLGAAFDALGLIPALSTGAAGTILHAFSLFAMLAGVAGHSALCLYLSRLADWANDTTLEDRFKSSAYLFPAGAAAFVVAMLVRLLGFFGVLLSVGLYVVMLWSIFQFYMALWGFASIARWALINHASADARDIRMRERADREARESMVRPDPRVRDPRDVHGTSPRVPSSGVGDAKPGSPGLKPTGDDDGLFELAPDSH